MTRNCPILQFHTNCKAPEHGHGSAERQISRTGSWCSVGTDCLSSVLTCIRWISTEWPIPTLFSTVESRRLLTRNIKSTTSWILFSGGMDKHTIKQTYTHAHTLSPRTHTHTHTYWHTHTTHTHCSWKDILSPVCFRKVRQNTDCEMSWTLWPRRYHILSWSSVLASCLQYNLLISGISLVQISYKSCHPI